MPENTTSRICEHEGRELLDTDRIRQTVNNWFSGDWKKKMRAAAGGSNDWKQAEASSITEQIAMEWLYQDGKRWRPFLLACTYSALKKGTVDLPDEIHRLAIAVECFHKASLVHDDIEDGDDLRYGRPTLHKQYGVPVALNAGDLLVSEGYRWITTVEPHCAALLRVAAEKHRALCLGQGEELFGLSKNNHFTTEQMIEIFRRKTAPAFGVSLQLGAIAAGADSSLLETLDAFSESLGIAYQIHDDLEEYKSGHAVDLCASILPALARDASPEESNSPVEECIVFEKAVALLERYKDEAVRTLNPLQNPLLKSLLRQMVFRMLPNPEGAAAG